MNIQKLNYCMEMVERDVGDGFLASSIVSMADAQTIIATAKSSAKTATLFSQVTLNLQKSLSEGEGYPQLGRYYFLDLAGNKGILFIPLGDYQWGVAIDTKKAKLGLLLNVILPKMLDAFEDAVVSS
ncbi:MAG: hypothetical protein NTV58_05075 [Deltaproteobacteria bacterium]|nr:hypothetical protein [Deltaproteobacteria bacterium]